MITVRAHTKRIGVIVVMFSLLILAAGTQAQALTLYSFKGKVTDALGRALAGG